MIDETRLFSAESEQAVIGGLLLAPEKALDRIGALRPHHFYTEARLISSRTSISVTVVVSYAWPQKVSRRLGRCGEEMCRQATQQIGARCRQSWLVEAIPS